MNLGRRGFAKSLAGAVGAFAARPQAAAAPAPQQAQAPPALARAQTRLPPATITRIRVFYPLNYDRNGPQAFPQSNMVVLVDTDAGITGIGQGGSPDTVRNVARSVIGRNAFDTEMIWQARLHGWLLLARQGAAARARRDRSRACGTSRARRWTRRSINSSAARPASTSSCTRRQACRSGLVPAGGGRGDGPQGTGRGDDGGRVPGVSESTAASCRAREVAGEAPPPPQRVAGAQPAVTRPRPAAGALRVGVAVRCSIPGRAFA